MKKILIVSDMIDQTTNHVIDWLWYYDKKFWRINQGDGVTVSSIKIDNGGLNAVIHFNNQDISYENIASFWYRKGDIDFDKFQTRIKDFERVDYYFEREWNTIKVFFISIIEQKTPLIGNYFTRNPNKLLFLQKAKEANLLIPETIIVSEKEYIVSQNKEGKSWITKPIQDIFSAIYKKKYYYSYTENFDFKTTEIPSDFFPTQIQKKIEKIYELRIFFIRDMLFPMAIFSQNDEKTRVDFRNYNSDNPNRFVPYKLPLEIEYNLKKFIKITSLNTGSIDIIVDKKRDYYFLEVNPNGQFGMVSEPCNYYLEKLVATLL